MKSLQSLGSQGWLLLVGCVLAAVGLARQTPESPTQVMPVGGAAANADSNNRMVAVTGTDITGASILYLVDTVNYQMAVYQATGGGESTQGLKLVGARRIDLDLELSGFNDKSKWTHKELQAEFEKQGLLPSEQ